jgi:hypothetical protein
LTDSQTRSPFLLDDAVSAMQLAGDDSFANGLSGSLWSRL